MATAAINAQSGHVMLMAERHRLRLAHTLVRDIGRALDRIRGPYQCSHDEDGAKDRGAGQRIRAAMKNLRHSLIRSCERDPAPVRDCLTFCEAPDLVLRNPEL